MSDSNGTDRKCTKCGGPIIKKPTESKSAFAKRKTCGCKKSDVGLVQSDGKPHLSRYAGGYVSNAQYLAEIMCERRATAENRKLPLRFWDTEEDGPYFMQQLRAANALVARYGYDVVFSGISLPETKACYSLSAKWLSPILFREYERVNKLRSEASVVVEVEDLPMQPVIEYKPPVQRSSTVMSKLRGLYGQREEGGGRT